MEMVSIEVSVTLPEGVEYQDFDGDDFKVKVGGFSFMAGVKWFPFAD